MPTHTQAIVIPGKGENFIVKDVVLEDPEEDEVLVKIIACGICHTDLSIQSGQFPAPYPCVAGHEGGGIVVSTGSAVTSLKANDKVLLSYTSCQKCGACKAHQPYCCPLWGAMNFGRVRSSVIGDRAGARYPKAALGAGLPAGADGEQEKREDGESKGVIGKEEGGDEQVWGAFFGQSSMAKMAIVSEASCIKVPDDTDLKLFAPLGCGLQTGSGAILNRLKPEKDSSIAVFGLGAVGMSAILACAYLNIQQIIAVDLNDERLALAKEFGATHTVNIKGLSNDEALAKIRKGTRWDGAGPDYAVECSGNMKAWRMAYEAIRNGGTIVSCGSPGPGFKPEAEVHESICVAKNWFAVLMGCGYPKEFVPKLVQMHKEGKFPIEKMVKTYKFEDIDKAVHAMHTGEVIKPVLVFNDE